MQKSKITLHALHGFLGFAGDWAPVLPRGVEIQSHDLFASQGSLAERASALNSQVRGPGQILVGYSLGGRIALHALTQTPERWAAAVIVSANPGISSAAHPTERANRIESDRTWARRFLEEDWSTLLPAWDAQPVFARQGDVPACHERNASDPHHPHDRRIHLSRAACAEILTSCSLGLQEDLRPKIAQLTLPILWISGQQDAKYSQIAEQMGQLGACAVSVPGAGHRVPWEQPALFRSEVERFLATNFAPKY